MPDMFSVLFISSDGEGLAKHVSVSAGTIVGSFLTTLGLAKPEDYVIRINRQLVDPSRLLSQDDRISVTPRTVRGAVRSPRRRTFIRFLRRKGYSEEQNTATDHANWRSPYGVPLKVN